MVLNDGMTVHNELEMRGRGVLVAEFKVWSRHLPEGTEKTSESLLGKLVSWTRLEPCTYRTEVRSVTALANFLANLITRYVIYQALQVCKAHV
jgi:hypothetical protein